MDDHKQMIKRIGELTQLARERELTPEEALERGALRETYLKQFRKTLRGQLDNTVVQQEDGTKVPLKDYQRAAQGDAAQQGNQNPKPD